MPFILKQTAHYLQDIRKLPLEIREKDLPQTHRQLQQDPQHNSLYTHLFNGFRSERVYRSRVDQKYRIAWWYDDDHSIVLWRVGIHKMIDELENLKRLPPVEVEGVIPVPAMAETAQQPARDHRSDKSDRPAYGPLPLFGGYSPTQLQLFGVPEALVPEVRRAIDMDRIYQLGLPPHANAILESIYTNPDWTPDDLLDVRQVLYRANADQLEDYCRGKIRSLMLDLTDEQTQIIHTHLRGVMLIKGVAGSGKTTVGVYRALGMARNLRMFTSRPVIFLTYNVTLAKVVQQMLDELMPDDERETLRLRLKVQTLREWALAFLADKDWQFDPQRAETHLALATCKCAPADANYQFLKQENFLAYEIGQVIKGRGLESWDAYRSVRRVGRGQPLNENSRRIIWDIYCDYMQRMQAEKIWDEADLYLEAASRIETTPAFEAYAEVVVDEAQDLPPKALALAAKIAGGGDTERLALLADPAQSIYYRGVSWKDGGVSIHSSRVRKLEKNFRNSRPILQAAWALAKAEPTRALDEALEPRSTDRPGPKPVLIEANSQSDQDIKRLKALLVKLTGGNRYRFGDIAILCRKINRLNAITLALRQSGFPVCHFREAGFEIFENDLKVITVNSAKGLEFPVVILMDVNEGDLPRDLAHVQDADDLAAALRIERQLLYVGMTRAADELYMISSRGRQSRFLKDIPAGLIRRAGEEDGSI